LRELVACKDLKTRIRDCNIAAVDDEGYALVEVMEREYERRKPLAWDAARRALADD
jgi:hypothetical protein